MVRSSATIMAIAMLVGLILIELPCLEAQSPVEAPTSPGAPTTSASAPAPDCLTVLSNVTDCLSFVQVGSNLTVPDKACCPEFAGLLDGNPICLCQLIGNPESLGIDINRALMLPDACKVEIPPLDSCPASPVPAPTPSSISEAPGSTTAGPVPDGGEATSPASPNGGSNGASGTMVQEFSTLVCLAVAIFIACYF